MFLRYVEEAASYSLRRRRLSLGMRRTVHARLALLHFSLLPFHRRDIPRFESLPHLEVEAYDNDKHVCLENRRRPRSQITE